MTLANARAGRGVGRALVLLEDPLRQEQGHQFPLGHGHAGQQRVGDLLGGRPSARVFVQHPLDQGFERLGDLRVELRRERLGSRKGSLSGRRSASST